LTAALPPEVSVVQDELMSDCRVCYNANHVNASLTGAHRTSTDPEKRHEMIKCVLHKVNLK